MGEIDRGCTRSIGRKAGESETGRAYYCVKTCIDRARGRNTSSESGEQIRVLTGPGDGLSERSNGGRFSSILDLDVRHSHGVIQPPTQAIVSTIHPHQCYLWG